MRYFKPLLVIILMIMAYRYENPVKIKISCKSLFISVIQCKR